MNDSTLLDLPVIDGQAAVVETPIAKAAAAAVDLQKVTLRDVALAHFGDWRADVDAARANLSTLALDLSIPARIAEAKSLRQRVIRDPLAEVRKINKTLKSALSKVSKDVGEEAEAAEKAWMGLEPLITPAIDEAEAAIEARKQREAEEKAQREAALKARVVEIFAPWLERAGSDEMTAERIGVGIEKVAAQAMPEDLAEVAEFFAQEKAATITGMERLKTSARLREEKAEADRLAAEREKAAALRRKLDEIKGMADGHERAGSEHLRRILAAAETMLIEEDEWGDLLILAEAAKATLVQKLRTALTTAEAEEARIRAEEEQAALAAQAEATIDAPDTVVEVKPAESGEMQHGADDDATEQAAGMSDAEREAVQLQVEALHIDDTAVDGMDLAALRAYADELSAMEITPEEFGELVAPAQHARSVSLEVVRARIKRLDPDVEPARPIGSPVDPTVDAPNALNELLAHIATAFAGKFPNQPKVSASWWAGLKEKAAAVSATRPVGY
jgi:hypothetical protein